MKGPSQLFARVALPLAVAALALASCFVEGEADDSTSVKANPIAKVIVLITDLQGKVEADGDGEAESFRKFTNWCDNLAREHKFSIHDALKVKESLEAVIEKAASDAQEATVQLTSLSGDISMDEADLKAATLLREKEQGDFAATDKELGMAVETLARARHVLDKELSKGGRAAGSSFLQRPSQGLQIFTNALSELASCAKVVLSADDQGTINSFIQRVSGKSVGSDDDDDDDDSQGAPAVAAYKSHSGGIQETLKDLEDKLVESRNQARTQESKAQHNFNLFKSAMESKIASQKKDLEETKKGLAESQETKANAEGELEMCTKDLTADQESLAKLQHKCLERASTYETELRDRQEEMKALAAAKKAIQEKTGGAEEQAYSFVQVGYRRRLRDGPANLALRRLKQLAADTHSAALAQLSSRLSNAIRTRTRSGDKARGDPFLKVKGLVQDLIEKLEKENQQEAAMKAYCDREMTHTLDSKTEKEEEIAMLSSKWELSTSQVAKLKEEIAALQNEVLESTQSQVEQDQMRKDESAQFVKVKADYDEGIKGMQVALKVLRDYYAEDDGAASAAALVQTDDQVESASDTEEQAEDKEVEDMGSNMVERASGRAPQKSAGTVIIGLLQVIESDLAKNLAVLQEEEETAQDNYDKLTQENKVSKARKQTSIKHKTAELLSHEKSITETQADRAAVSQELDAVSEYLTELKPQCVSKPDSYEERKGRLMAEIQGLREALEILESEGETR